MSIELSTALLIAGVIAGAIGLKFWRSGGPKPHAQLDLSQLSAPQVSAPISQTTPEAIGVATPKLETPSTIELFEKSVEWLKGKAE